MRAIAPLPPSSPCIALLGLCCLTAPIAAQVSIHPSTTTPAAWERFAVRVINRSDTATVSVRVDVPEAITILGVEPLPGWTFELTAATDTTPQSLAWSGGQVGRGEFREFVFLGRLKGDARRTTLVFPVRLVRPDSSTIDWTGRSGAGRTAPRVMVVGQAWISTRGAVALAGAAMGVAVLAVALALAKRRR